MVEDFFDKTCKFEAPTKTPDGLGSTEITYGGSPKTERFTGCSIRELSASEIRLNDKLTAISTHRIYFNVRNIDNTWRAIIDGKIYNITSTVKHCGEYSQADLRILE
jgi:hypothetical protein